MALHNSYLNLTKNVQCIINVDVEVKWTGSIKDGLAYDPEKGVNFTNKGDRAAVKYTQPRFYPCFLGSIRCLPPAGTTSSR